QLRAIYGAVWPGLSDARWQELAHQSYRLNAAGAPEPDADPLIGEPLRNNPAAARDLWPLWAALADVPVLAIRGADSDILSEATLEPMQRTKPQLRVLRVPGRGHPPLLDEPGCLEAIEEFLAA